MHMIINQTYQTILHNNQSKIDKLVIKRLIFGVNMTAVVLSDNSIGVASTLFQKRSRPHKQNRYYGDFSPSKYCNQKVSDLFKFGRSSDLIDSLRIAVLNAISSKQVEAANYKIIYNTDPIDLINIDTNKSITLVGAFRSYIDLISKTSAKLKVLELDENIFIEEHKKFYIPAEEYKTILPNSDIIIITGLTLVNNTIDGLLSAAKKESQVIVVGPSANVLPDILFKNGVDIIGATRYNNPDLLFMLIQEGANAYHLFKYCAQKICIINE
ncbi:MAG: DUF364 domain-containing protein [Bacteroidales bacterium]|nr:DUF364 domain-containing protein [Bacteroidales bacterium]